MPGFMNRILCFLWRASAGKSYTGYPAASTRMRNSLTRIVDCPQSVDTMSMGGRLRLPTGLAAADARRRRRTAFADAAIEVLGAPPARAVLGRAAVGSWSVAFGFGPARRHHLQTARTIWIRGCRRQRLNAALARDGAWPGQLHTYSHRGFSHGDERSDHRDHAERSGSNTQRGQSTTQSALEQGRRSVIAFPALYPPCILFQRESGRPGATSTPTVVSRFMPTGLFNDLGLKNRLGTFKISCMK